MNIKYLGDEPVFQGDLDNVQYVNALNWYNYMSTTDECKTWLSEYLKNNGRVNDARRVRSIPDTWFPNTAGYIARIINLGGNPPNGVDFINKKLEESFSRKEEVKEEKETTVKFSIQDKIREKASDILGEVEGMVDDCLFNNVEFSLYDYMKSNEIPSMYASKISSYYEPVVLELEEARKGKCDQLKEGYSHLTKKMLDKRIKIFTSIISDANRYGDVAKKTRAPRKPRPVSMDKKLKTFKYQKEDNEFKIASINPTKIIGAQELWMFNTKYKTLTVLRALDRGGLDVKGTSIIGYDDKNSFTKRTGRKTEVYVNKVKDSGKVALKKIMLELKKDAPLAYRSNENTVLLRLVT